MITLLAVSCGVVSLFLYLFAGWRVAKGFLPMMWKKARVMWFTSEAVSRSVRYQIVCMILLWPVMGLYYLMTPVWGALKGAFYDAFNIVITQSDPTLTKRDIESRTCELEEWHRQWEAEYGMKGSEE